MKIINLPPLPGFEPLTLFVGDHGAVIQKLDRISFFIPWYRPLDEPISFLFTPITQTQSHLDRLLFI